MKEIVYQHQITGNIITSMLPLKGWLKDWHYYIPIKEVEEEKPKPITKLQTIKTLNLWHDQQSTNK